MSEIPDKELEEIERRAEAATKGPWEAFVEGRDHHGGDNFIRTGGLDNNSPDMYISRDGVPAGWNDLDFIASARQDVPRLVADTQAARAEVASGVIPARWLRPGSLRTHLGEPSKLLQ